MKQIVNFIFHIIVWFQIRIKRYRLKLAIKMAKNKQKRYNKRYFVFERKGKFVALCRDELIELRRRGIVYNNITHIEMMNICKYSTPLKWNEKKG